MQQDTNQSFDIPLHDIKPILDIQEYSFYYFLGLVFVSIVLTIAIVYLIYKWIKVKKTFNQRAHNYKLLNSLDLSDTKNSAYAITSIGVIFKDDSQRHSEMFANLSQRLEAFKYKKNVEEFDDEVLGYIELYKGMIDV